MVNKYSELHTSITAWKHFELYFIFSTRNTSSNNIQNKSGDQDYIL